MNILNRSIAVLLIAVLALIGCGGGGDSAPQPTTLSGTAAVGYPIVGGTVTVTCAAGAAITGIPNTSATGAWSVTLSGQTLPCAVQVSGGTINALLNTTTYQSIANAYGTVNVTPLTGMLVANLAGTVAALTPAQLSTINSTQIATALQNLRTALGLAALNGIDPITTAFNPTGGVVMDDILTALSVAMNTASVTYANLLTAAGASQGATITLPAGLTTTTIAAAYANTTSGGPGGGTTANVTGFSPSSGAVGASVTITGTNLVTAFPPAPLIKFDAFTATVTGSSNTSMTVIVPTGLALGMHTITIGGATGTPLTVGNFNVTSTGGVIPAAPTGVTATPQAATAINIGWTAVSGATAYNVYRSTTTGVAITPANLVTTSPVADTSFGDSGLTASTTYYYKVTAINATGESLGSAEVSATTSADGGGNQMGGAIVGSMLNLTGTVSTLAGNVSGGFADGAGTAASFSFPLGITTDGTNLYVMDSFNNRIRKVVIATGEVTTLAGSTAGFADGTGTAARFNYPKGITTDGTNLYVADTMNHRIRKVVIATGEVTSLAGDIGGYADGTGIAARFFQPAGITTDGLNLFVADTSNNRIRKVVIATGEVTTLVGNATNGWADGTGTAAMFSGPRGITTDGTHIYVADAGASDKSIRKIVIATGVVTTLAGKTYTGFADGTGTAAIFASPADITTDGVYLYVADYGNERIRKILTTTGEVTTLAGSATGYADGTGSTASFSQPYGITSDGASLYVTDSYNYLIRKIQ